MLKNTIILHQFHRLWGIPNASTFCAKLETFLRMYDIPYILGGMGDTRTAPKGKLPYIVDNGRKIPDSSFIIEYLANKHSINLDENLSADDKAISVSFQRLIEENLYWAMNYYRWQLDSGWAIIKEPYFRQLPVFLKWIIPCIIRKQVIKALYSHGMGRHSQKEVFQIVKKDIDAVAAFLGNKKFFLGDKPAVIDCIVYGSIINLVNVPLKDEITDYCKTKPNLIEYCNSMTKKYFPEFKA